MDLEKTEAQMTIYLNFLKQLNLLPVSATQLEQFFLMSRKLSTKFGMTVFSLG